MSTQQEQGLYNAQYEHDACGVGMVVNIHGNKSHELVDNALKVLENMEHRGAETRDKTGDGAGILLQIPHEFILLLSKYSFDFSTKIFYNVNKIYKRIQKLKMKEFI